MYYCAWFSKRTTDQTQNTFYKVTSADSGTEVPRYRNSLLRHPSRTFVGDVLKREFFPYGNPLFWCPNAVLTPHIAGSTGNEGQRMAYYMTEELERYLAGEPAKYEVTAEMLERMA